MRGGARGSAWSTEEQRLALEIALLFGEPAIEVVATGVHAPVFYGIGQSVYVETDRSLGAEEAQRLLLRGRGLLVAGSTPGDGPRGEVPGDPLSTGAMADPAPGPIEVAGSDAVHVAHLRADPRREGVFAFWLCFDDQRKGIALNAVAALEIALRDVRG